MKKNLIHQPLFRVLVPPIYGTMMYLLILLLNNSLGQLGDTVFTIEMLVCVALAFLISLNDALILLSKSFHVRQNFSDASITYLIPLILPALVSAVTILFRLLIKSLVLMLSSPNLFSCASSHKSGRQQVKQ